MNKGQKQGATPTYLAGARRANRAARKAAPLAEGFSKRFAAYVAGAGAAGVGLLALAQPAEAGIVYTPAHIALTRGHLDLDLNNDGRVDFKLIDVVPASTGGSHASFLSVKPGLGSQRAGVVPVKTFKVDPAALEAGYKIGPGDSFLKLSRLSPGPLALFSTYASQGNGYWVNVDHRYLGLVFTIGGQIHYGWAEFSVNGALGQGITAVLEGYAYESTPNKPILTGQTGKATAEPDSTAPGQTEDGVLPTVLVPGEPDPATAPGPVKEDGLDPATLGLLALGSLGLGFWRGKQQESEVREQESY